MKNYPASFFILPIFVALTSAPLTAGPIVVSDGPDTQTQSQGTAKKIVETDGPQEWVKASQSGQALVGSWVIETDGPGKGRLVGPNAKLAAPAVTASKVVIIDSPEPVRPPKHEIPDAETSTLAPAIPVEIPIQPPLPAIPPAPASSTNPPFASGAAWTTIAIMGVIVFFLLTALVWKRRNN